MRCSAYRDPQLDPEGGGAAYQSSCSGVNGLSSRSTHASSLARDSGVGVEYDRGLVRLELHEEEEAADAAASLIMSCPLKKLNCSARRPPP